VDRRLREIKEAVDRLAKVVGATPSQLPTYGSTADFAQPHIEVHGIEYHWVVIERGQVSDRRVFTTLDELLFQVFSSVTFSLACEWELTHRVPGKDCRRAMFLKQIELLDRLEPAWAQRERQHHEEALVSHPFDDSSDARVALSKRLRSEGATAHVAWHLACKAYPLPRPPGQ